MSVAAVYGCRSRDANGAPQVAGNVVDQAALVGLFCRVSLAGIEGALELGRTEKESAENEHAPGESDKHLGQGKSAASDRSVDHGTGAASDSARPKALPKTPLRVSPARPM